MNRWTTLPDISIALKKKWDQGLFLREVVEPTALFPLDLSLRGPTASELSNNFGASQAWVQEFIDTSSKRPFTVLWSKINNRQLGANELPVTVRFGSMGEVVDFLGKKREFGLFVDLHQQLMQRLPQLNSWLSQHPLSALEHAASWDRLIHVGAWLHRHPRPAMYLRQMSIPNVDTKFVERHKKLLGEWLDLILDEQDIATEHSCTQSFEMRYGFLPKPALVRFRILDTALFLHGLTDITLRADEFCRLSLPVSKVFVTENDINGLAFPQAKGSIVLFGRGYGFEHLKNASWLHSADIYYWGDIDTHGFAILNQFRKAFPHTRSLFMDTATLLTHKNMWVTEQSPAKALLAHLTHDEQMLYRDLIENRYGTRVRLEQEVVSYTDLILFVNNLFSTGE